MHKAYQHQSEDAIYELWEQSGAMMADPHSTKQPFTIPIPPPNVTGKLHLGHAAMLAIEDILIRYKKMKGFEALWVPGTDHAAIATETVVLKNLGIKDRSTEITREDFMTASEDFVEVTGGQIRNQFKKLGAWLDWSREAYTFDESRNFAVNKIFKKLYEDGLIYRGSRMINWSSGAQSVLADDELEWEDSKETFYSIKCGEFIVGTVRSETKCADSPVVVHPEAEYVRAEFADSKGSKNVYILVKNLFDDEERRSQVLNLLDPEGTWTVLNISTGKELEGQSFEFETYAGKRSFVVLADEVIDPNKGTGAMTISCHHSLDDYEMAKRHNLEPYFFNKIDFKGHMTSVTGECEGLTVREARLKSAQIMKTKGLLVGEDKTYKNRTPICYRSGCVVEPMVSPQWFIGVEREFTDQDGNTTTLKKQMQEAVRENHVEIIPAKFNKTYFQWIDNLRDWCISRQIWWGHRIPVWYDDQNNIHLAEERTISFVRHGESTGNANKTVQQDSDKLTAQGKEHAVKSAQGLKGRKIGKIITSPALRASQTAQIIAQEIGFEGEIEEWDEFGGLNFGEWLGKPLSELPDGMHAIDTMNDTPDAESQKELFARIKKGWEKIKDLNFEGELLIISHRTIYSGLQAVQQKGDSKAMFEARMKNENIGHTELGSFKTFIKPPSDKPLRQDEDTLDTWFSSALWPFATLGWPDEENEDFKKFYPTQVLETGHDILFFWVARMIMFGKYGTGEYPFKTVYLHGMVTDEKGKKMSKSKGNGIDPIDSIEKFGADAIRLSLVIGTSPGQNIPIGDAKISGYRNFVNKLWNAGRFIQMTADDDLTIPTERIEPSNQIEKWMAHRLAQTIESVQENLDKFQISPAGDAIYHFVWNDFCDWFIEASKAEKNIPFLIQTYVDILKLAHPLCPFVTESLWRDLFGKESLLILESYPEAQGVFAPEADSITNWQELVNQIRSLRADKKLNPKEKLTVQFKKGFEEEIKKLTILFAGVVEGDVSADAVLIKQKDLEISVEIPVDEARIEAEKNTLVSQIEGLKGRLANKAYTDKAPEHLVQQTKDQLKEAEEKLASYG